MGKTKSKAKSTSTTTSTESARDNLNEKQTAALQLVTVSPGPRTPQELANNYDGIREANLWPEQSPDEVKRNLAYLVEKKLLVEGEEAPDGEKVVELPQ